MKFKPNGLASARQKAVGVPGGTKVSSDAKSGLARLKLRKAVKH